MTRDEYTWGQAREDIALTSHLTLSQTTDLTRKLEQAGTYPPRQTTELLIWLLFEIKERSYEQVGALIVKLGQVSSQTVRLQGEFILPSDPDFKQQQTNNE